MFCFRPTNENKTSAESLRKYFFYIISSAFRKLQRWKIVYEANSETNYKFPEPVIRRRSETVWLASLRPTPLNSFPSQCLASYCFPLLE